MSDGGLLDILNELTLSVSETRQTVDESSDTLHGGPTECPVCMEQMVEPTILPGCGHTFCRNCLKEICKKEGRTLRCPIDRRPCVLPSDGVDGLPMNYALRDMIEESRLVTEDPESLHSLGECSECHSTASLHLCGHCRRHLCKECIDVHHDLSTARLRQLSRQFRGIRGRCEKSLTQRRSLLEEQQKMCDGVREKVSDFTNKFLSKLKEIVTMYKQYIFDKIAKQQSLLEEKMRKQIEELEDGERYVNECKTRTDNILDSKSMSVSESQIKALNEGTSAILDKSVQEVSPKPMECRFLIPSEEQQDVVYQQVADLLGVERLTSYLSIGKKEAAKQPSACNSEPEERPTVYGQADSDVDGSSLVSVQWSELGTGEGYAAGRFNRPRGVDVSHASRTICVADCSNHRLQWFNYDTSHIRTVGKEGAAAGEFNCPVGVACTPDGHFVISDWNNHRVQVVDGSGAVVRVMGKRGSGDGSFNKPLGVAVDNSTGHIYVCDHSNHRVQIIRADGEFVGTFGSNGASDGQFNLPAGIALAQGQVVVADYNNNRLQVFTTAGEHTRTITGDHLKLPLGVVMSQAGNKVYVCCDTGIVVYQLSPTVELVKHIPSPVAGKRPAWIALLSDSDALVTSADVHVVHRILVNSKLSLCALLKGAARSSESNKKAR